MKEKEEIRKMEIPDIHFGTHGVCSYCGEPSNSVDHVIPYSALTRDNKERNAHVNSSGITTNACMDCNSSLSSTVFFSWKERIHFIQSKIGRQSRKFRNSPSWSQDELDDLDHTLRTAVEHGILAIEKLDRQSLWTLSPEYHDIFEDLVESGPFLDKASRFHLTLHAFFNEI